MKCPSCHTENAAEAKFCGNCGHSLTEEVVASSTRRRVGTSTCGTSKGSSTK